MHTTTPTSTATRNAVHVASTASLTMGQLLLQCQKDPSSVEEDVWIKGANRYNGVSLCQNRFELILPILKGYDGEFNVIDFSAKGGYFAMRTAESFPESKVVALNHIDNDPSHQSDMLYQLCHLNDLKNVIYMDESLNLSFLQTMRQKCYFDVAYAFLTIHRLNSDMDMRKVFINQMLQSARQVIFELSNDVAPELLAYMEEFSKTCTTHIVKEIGIVDRYYDPTTAHGGHYPNAKGVFFLFTAKTPANRPWNFNADLFDGMHLLYPRKT
jgi:hypothetical protein